MAMRQFVNGLPVMCFLLFVGFLVPTIFPEPEELQHLWLCLRFMYINLGKNLQQIISFSKQKF
jgi:hypothetical protein